MRCNWLSIPICCTLGIDKQFYATLYNACNYLSILWLKFIRVAVKVVPDKSSGVTFADIVRLIQINSHRSWWRHQMETFSALLTICAGNSPVPSEFPGQRPVTRNFDVFFDLRLNKRLSKQWWVWWFETPSRPLWRHCNEYWFQISARPWTATMLSIVNSHHTQITLRWLNKLYWRNVAASKTRFIICYWQVRLL